MGKRIALGFAVLVGALSGFFVLFLVSMRMKFRPAQDAVRRINRVTWNPRSMKTAGRPGAYASVIRHVGRTSGTPYETPVGAVETEDGFVIALPYGTSPDWLKNVLAEGSAIIVNEGNTYGVDHPELVSAAVGNPYFPASDQRTHRLFGIDDFLLLRQAESE
jgi:deazaflavin-dependent oxidoreductase (nitroreductase family)